MKLSKAKHTVKKLGAKMLTASLFAAMALSSVGASAITAIDPADKVGANGGKYYSEFSSNAELQATTIEVNKQIAAEGAILLKNGGGESGTEDMLPYSDLKRVSVFGIMSDAYGYGGTGSGSGTLEAGADIYSSFENAGIAINPQLKALYQKYSGGSLSMVSAYTTPTYEDKELDLSYYTESIQATYKRYDDAAIVVIGRLGGEGADLATEDVADHVRPDPITGELIDFNDEHYLELTYREEQLIAHVKENFDRVIVLLNSGNIIEFGELENDPGIDAIMNIVQTGDYGFDSVLEILKGNVNPSGRTVDIYSADFTVDPVWQNFGNGNQTVENGQNTAYTGASTSMVEYEEGIYLGYKYYETMYAEIAAGNVDLDAEATKAVLGSADLGTEYEDADDWYEKNVIYPFGYGLSYTTFNWTFDSMEMDTATLTKDTKFTATVTVENTGDVAGKDVVELYMGAPYDKIQRAAKQLVGFAKTDLLEPGETDTVTISFDAYDIAAYDYSDANNNGHAGYEIEAGVHTFYASKNSHDVVASKTLDLAALKITTSQATGVEIVNRFVDSPKEGARFNYSSISPTMTIMSRSDMIGTFPKAPTAEERTLNGEDAATAYNPLAEGKDYKITKAEVADKVGYGFRFGTTSGEDEIWNVWGDNEQVIPDGWTQATDTNGEVAIRLPDLMGISPYDTETVIESDNEAINGKTGEEAWEAFMNQLTYTEIKTLTHTGFFKTAPLARIGKEETVDADGPCTIGGQTKDGYIGSRGPSGTRYWCSAQMLASTWNVELARTFGDLIGEEGMWNNYNGWYAPSMNTHRSPLSGRNFEYYSQDGVHGGLIAGAVIAGVSSHGIFPYIKHYAANDQETNRNNIATWADEQVLREIILKPFQYAVEQGGSCGVMTGFNRIGAIDCPEHYPLMTQILREEWGFDGHVVTDYQVGTVGAAHNNMEVFHYAGTNIPLGDRSSAGNGEWDATLRDGKGGVYSGDVKECRDADIAYYYERTRAMEILYTQARSSAIDNGADFQKNFTGGTINIPVGYAYSATIPTGFDEDANIRFEVASASLPENVTYNATNGTFDATNRTTISSGNAQIKVFYDGWVNKTVRYNVNVVDVVTYTGNKSMPVGEAYEATVSQGFWKVGVNNVSAITASVSGLPAGLTFDAETETISGTPTAAGVYNVTITYRVTDQAYNTLGTLETRNTDYRSTYALTVGEIVTVTINGEETTIAKGGTVAEPEAPEAPEGQRFVGWFVGDTEFDFETAIEANTTIVAKFEAIPDTIEFRVEDGKIQASINGGAWVDVVELSEIKGEKGDAGETGPAGPAGSAGKDGKDGAGCGGVIGVSSAIAATVVLGAAALVLRKKED